RDLMHLRVEHRFAFEYDAFISESFLELRVQPKTTPQQAVSAFELAIGPPTSVHRYRDWNDNLTHHFTITKFHDRIAVSTRSLVQTHRSSVAIASLTERPRRDGLPYPLNDFLQFGGPVTLTAGLRAAHRAIGLPATATLGEQVAALGAYIAKRFVYRKNVTTYSSTTEDFLKIGGGVCQDFAHLMLGLLRLRGIPCRYVSGYLHVERKKKERARAARAGGAGPPPAGGGGAPWPRTPTAGAAALRGVGAAARISAAGPPKRGFFRGTARKPRRAGVVRGVVPPTPTAPPRGGA